MHVRVDEARHEEGPGQIHFKRAHRPHGGGRRAPPCRCAPPSSTTTVMSGRGSMPSVPSSTVACVNTYAIFLPPSAALCAPSSRPFGGAQYTPKKIRCGPALHPDRERAQRTPPCYPYARSAPVLGFEVGGRPSESRSITERVFKLGRRLRVQTTNQCHLKARPVPRFTDIHTALTSTTAVALRIVRPRLRMRHSGRYSRPARTRREHRTPRASEPAGAAHLVQRRSSDRFAFGHVRGQARETGLVSPSARRARGRRHEPRPSSCRRSAMATPRQAPRARGIRGRRGRIVGGVRTVGQDLEAFALHALAYGAEDEALAEVAAIGRVRTDGAFGQNVGPRSRRTPPRKRPRHGARPPARMQAETPCSPYTPSPRSPPPQRTRADTRNRIRPRMLSPASACARRSPRGAPYRAAARNLFQASFRPPFPWMLVQLARQCAECSTSPIRTARQHARVLSLLRYAAGTQARRHRTRCTTMPGRRRSASRIHG